jgi:hypothetical protein
MNGDPRATNPPVACCLENFTAEEARRHHELTRKLGENIVSSQRLVNGYTFRLKDSFSLTTLSEWIELERRCCAFFTFEIQVAGANPGIQLTVTGPPQAAELIQTFVPEELKRTLISPDS